MLSREVTQRGGPNHGALRYWARFMGASSSNDRKLDAISPVEYVDQVKIPVQLIHGVDDTVVPYFQSEIMVRALRKSGAPVELVPLKGEDHWLSRSTTRTEMLTAMAGFIERVNPPGEARAAAGR